MNNLLVYAYTGASGEAAVAEKGWTRTVSFDEVADEGIKLFSRDTLTDLLSRRVKRLAGYYTGFLHYCQLFFVFQFDHISCLFPEP